MTYPSKTTDRTRFLALRNRATRVLKCEFELSWWEYVELVAQACRYCGLPGASSADRLDNSKGYSKDNIVACCKVCNDMKKAHSEDFFIAHVRRIREYTVGTVVDLDAEPTEWRNLQRIDENEQTDDQLSFEDFAPGGTRWSTPE